MTVVFTRSNPVNPDSRVEKEVNALLKEGYEVIILAWDRDRKYDIEEEHINMESGIARVLRFGIPAKYGGGVKKNLLPLIQFQISLYRWLKKNRNDYGIIHACDFDTAFISSKIAKRYNKKFIYDIFDYYVDAFNVPTLLRSMIERADHNTIKFADATIICTEKRREQIRTAKPNKLFVIHNTPNQSTFKENKLKFNGSKVKIVYVGILSEGRLLKEVSEYIVSNLECEFHVGGFGQYENYFEKLSKECSNIFFYGKIPYDKTLELENSCDVMIAIYDPSVPNHYYAAPNKFYEALMLGKPLIMAQNTGMDDIVYKNCIGEVIEYSAEGFKEGLEKLLSQKHLWDDMTYKMQGLYNKHYRWEKMERRLIELYKIITDKDESDE